MSKKAEIGQNAKVNIKWKVNPIDYSRDMENNIAVKFATKYSIPVNNVSIEPVFIKKEEDGTESEFVNDVVDNIQDPKFQQKLFNEFINLKEIKDCNFERIIEIDNLINNSINYDVYDKRKKYAIKWIKWSNFMSYGEDNYFDFTDLRDLVLLTSEPANQGGKSTFCLDLLRFLLFGKVTSRESDWTLSKVFNKHLPESTEVKVEGCINIDGEDYVIRRVVTRPALKKRTEKSKVSQKINYYHIVNGEYLDLVDGENKEESSTTATNKIIKEAIGNERDFDLMICVNSDNLKGLISLKDTERGRLIARWIGLLPLEEKDKIAREYYNKSIVPSLHLNKYNKEQLKIDNDDLSNEKKEFENSIVKLQANIDECDKKIEEYTSTKDTLLQSKQKIDESLLKVDITTVNAELKRLKENGIRKKAEWERNKQTLSELKDVEYSEIEYQNNLSEGKRLATDIALVTSDYRQTIKDIDVLKKGEYCPTCGAKLQNVDNSKAINEKEDLKSDLINKGKTLKQQIKDNEENKVRLEQLRKDYATKENLKLIVQKNEVDLEILRSQCREKQQIIKNINDNKTAIEQNNKIDTAINTITVNIKTEQSIKVRVQENINNTRVSIGTITKTIEKNKLIIEQIIKEEAIVRDWKIYLEMVGKNGISKLVLRKTLPLVNGELKHLLNDVCDFDVEIAIDDHNDVAFYLIHDGVKSNLASGSGFEQTVASLALRSILSKISSFSKPSFVVFDEVLGGVADENYEQIKLLYNKIVSDYQFIFQISHLKALFEWHKTIVTIIKDKNNISKIKSVY